MVKMVQFILCVFHHNNKKVDKTTRVHLDQRLKGAPWLEEGSGLPSPHEPGDVRAAPTVLAACCPLTKWPSRCRGPRLTLASSTVLPGPPHPAPFLALVVSCRQQRPRGRGNSKLRFISLPLQQSWGHPRHRPTDTRHLVTNSHASSDVRTPVFQSLPNDQKCGRGRV